MTLPRPATARHPVQPIVDAVPAHGRRARAAADLANYGQQKVLVTLPIPWATQGAGSVDRTHR